ncbi:hypothetical protein [Nocardiopsis sp. FIRDI 009]|uniref:hypothetical protein n=1 Tax=Nocardiopsis sp. FIRDI 009 TaxID=714197 RepID=UPI000E280366|nr:hypothetical protein [Nocardiopsis sp. FIRDI 009]
MPEPTRHAAALAGGAALAFLLSACGGGFEETEREPDTAADANAEDTEETAAAEEAVELVDPMELAPDDLCTVLSEETLTELLGEEDMRGEPQTTTGVPEPEELEERGRLEMSCMLISLTSYTLYLDMKVYEGRYVDSDYPDVTEEDADPDVDLGDFTVIGPGIGDGVSVTVVEGQVLVEVDYTRNMGEQAPEEELREGALLAAEEILAAVG